MRQTVDLDALAASYVHRPAGVGSLEHARRAIHDAGAVPGDWAVDVGGGPGEHAAVWAGLQIQAIVIDPTAGMVQASQQRPGVLPIRAVGQKLPLAAGCVRLVYFHLSIHYGDWRAALAESARVLCQRGEICIWTLGPAHHASSIQAAYFPSVRTIDEERFPDPGEIAAYLRSLGFAVKMHREVEPKQRKAGDWAAAVEARFISTLQLVDDEELRRGLEQFRADYPDPTEVVEYRLTWDHLRAARSNDT